MSVICELKSPNRFNKHGVTALRVELCTEIVAELYHINHSVLRERHWGFYSDISFSWNIYLCIFQGKEHIHVISPRSVSSRGPKPKQ